MSSNGINIPARRAYAEVLRHFAAGRLTTDQYESRAAKIESVYGTDAAIQCVWDAMWHTYDDIHVHRMTGSWRLGTHARRYVAQAILYLRKGEDGALPPFPINSIPNSTSTPTLLEQLATLTYLWNWVGIGLLLAAWQQRALMFLLPGIFLVGGAWLLRAWYVRYSTAPGSHLHDAAKPFDVTSPWPFDSTARLSAARRVPTYLCGVRSVSLAS